MSPALPLLLWLGTLAGVATLDVTAYLVSAARAQTLADAAALAAVSAPLEAPGMPAGATSPEAAARRLVAAAPGGSATLESCRCGLGAEVISVEVSVPVPGLVVPRLGASRVRASADAALVRARPADPNASAVPPIFRTLVQLP